MKFIARLVILVSLVLISGCVSQRSVWDEHRSSALREQILHTSDRSIVKNILIYEANASKNPLFESLRRKDGADQDWRQVSKFLGSMNLGQEFSNIYRLSSVYSSSNLDDFIWLDVKVHYGLSADLQLAGIHLSIENNSRNESPAKKCVDEIDLLSMTGFPSKHEFLSDKDAALSSLRENIRALFLKMIGEAKPLLASYLSDKDMFKGRDRAELTRLATYDGRVYTNLIASESGTELLAYRPLERTSNKCQPLHLFSVNRGSIDSAQMFAKNIITKGNNKLSRQKFRREQQNRNFNTLIQRIKKR